MFCRIIFSAFLTFVVGLLMGQAVIDTSSIELEDVEILSVRNAHYTNGYLIEQVPTQVLERYVGLTLAELLQDQSAIYIKSYGLGSAASTSFRGGNAAHTNLLWNGFSVNSPTHGQLDFALIPVQSLEKVSILPGGNSALWGSGAIGGSVLLESRPQQSDRFLLRGGVHFGSFGLKQQYANIFLPINNHSAYFKAYHSTSENDFQFEKNTHTGIETIRQSNAQIQQSGFLGGFNIKLRQHVLKLDYWYNQNDRSIPPTLLQIQSKARQKDHSWRFSGELPLVLNNWTITARTAYFNEFQNYQDVIVGTDDDNLFQTWIAEIETETNLAKNLRMRIGGHNTLASVQSDNYLNAESINRTALLFSLFHHSKDKAFQSSLNMREELLSGELLPLTWSLGSEWSSANKMWKIYGNIASVYRIPSFNDLYWHPGGNPDLKPEHGYTSDLGIKFQAQLGNKMKLHINPTVYYRDIKDWILWLPGQVIWTPRNLLHVRSRGIETKNKWVYQGEKMMLGLVLNTSYNLTTNSKSTIPGDNSVGRQLIYVPNYSGSAGIEWAYRNLRIAYLQTYTGYTYTSNDHSNYLPPFSLANIDVRYQFELFSTQIDVFGKILNLFDKNYQVVSLRPMPGINTQVGCSVQFSKIRNKPRTATDN